MSGDALGVAERLVLALIWSLGLLAALTEVLLGLIWFGGGVGDPPTPRDPSEVVVIRLAGIALITLGSLFVSAILWRFKAVWTFRFERRGAKKTARLLTVLTVLLIALGVVVDVARGDGKLFVGTVLGALGAPAVIAAAMILVEPRLTM